MVLQAGSSLSVALRCVGGLISPPFSVSLRVHENICCTEAIYFMVPHRLLKAAAEFPVASGSKTPPTLVILTL